MNQKNMENFSVTQYNLIQFKKLKIKTRPKH